MRRWFLRGVLASAVMMATLTLLILGQIQIGNFHAVVEGELYRSAQPTAADIAAYARDHQIKSILNLRGGNEGNAWYHEEVDASQKLGIKHMDFRMKAARELTDERVVELLEVMKNAPKPLLIHCRSGADRTGLAAALYLKNIAHRSEAESRQQLSLRYGHLPFWWTDAQAMDRTLDRVNAMAAPAQ